MVDTPTFNRRDGSARAPGTSMMASAAKLWFVHEVLPLEPMLMHFLRQNWRNASDLEDLRQEVYARVLEAAEGNLPEKAKPFVFATARNLLINRVLREQIVPFDAIAELDNLEVASDLPGPDRAAIARDELRKLTAALDRLPPRCREAVVLRRIEGFSRREIAQRMGVSENTVADHIRTGMNALADMLFGEPFELTRRS